jgi:excisionase family DNA binding protein
MDDDQSSAALETHRLHGLGTIAQCLNVSTKTVRRLIARGELGYHQVGRLKRVSDGQYLEYLTRIKLAPWSSR